MRNRTVRKVGPRSSGVDSPCVWCRYHAHCTLTYGLGCYADGEDACEERGRDDVPAVPAGSRRALGAVSVVR